MYFSFIIYIVINFFMTIKYIICVNIEFKLTNYFFQQFLFYLLFLFIYDELYYFIFSIK